MVSTDNGEKLLFTEKGMHTITIEVSLDNVRDAIKILTKIAAEMNDMALNIGKITGGNTERFRDFRLEDFDLDIEGKLNEWADTMDKVYQSLSVYSPGVSNIGELSALKVTAETLRTLAEEPTELPKRMDAFTKGPSSARQNLTTMIESLYQSPLGLINIYFPGCKGSTKGHGFL